MVKNKEEQAAKFHSKNFWSEQMSGKNLRFDNKAMKNSYGVDIGHLCNGTLIIKWGDLAYCDINGVTQRAKACDGGEGSKSPNYHDVNYKWSFPENLFFTWLLLTKSGVNPCPKTIPRGRDMARVIVATVRWLSENQCWLTWMKNKPGSGLN